MGNTEGVGSIAAQLKHWRATSANGHPTARHAGAAHIDLPCIIAAIPVPEGVGRAPLTLVPEKVEFPSLDDVKRTVL